MFTREHRQGDQSSKQSRTLSYEKYPQWHFHKYYREGHQTSRSGEPAHLHSRGSGFSSSPGVFESPVCPTISALHLFHFRVTTCALVSWVSYSRACKAGNPGDAECVWNRQATCPRHFMWQRKVYEKSKGWYGGTKRGLRLTHTSAGCTQGSAVTVQHHTLTC